MNKAYKSKLPFDSVRLGRNQIPLNKKYHINENFKIYGVISDHNIIVINDSEGGRISMNLDYFKSHFIEGDTQ